MGLSIPNHVHNWARYSKAQTGPVVPILGPPSWSLPLCLLWQAPSAITPALGRREGLVLVTTPDCSHELSALGPCWEILVEG